jgi:hypothetical protein
MGAGFPRNLDPIDYSDRMIKLCTSILEPAFHRPSPVGHISVGGRDELHEPRHEREEVVPSPVDHLGAAVRHVARLRVPRHDLARVHGILHERRADEHGRFPVGIREGGRARLLDAGEGGGGGTWRPQGNAVAGRRYLRRRPGLHGRGRGWTVTWGWWLVVLAAREGTCTRVAGRANVSAAITTTLERSCMRSSMVLGLGLVAGVRKGLGMA